MNRDQAPALVVLAAGMGSRYGALKQMDGFGPNGENIIDYSIYDAIQAGFGKVVFIIRESFKEQFAEFFSNKFDHLVEVEYVTQELDKLPDGFEVPEGREKPWGTGHAVMMAADVVDGPFAVINADDFYGRDAFFKIRDFFRDGSISAQDWCVVGYYLRNTLSDHGSVNRGVISVDDKMHLHGVEEIVKIQREEDGVIRYPGGEGEVAGTLSENSMVSMNIWGFLPNYFAHAEDSFVDFLNTRRFEPKSEMFIPTVVDKLIAANRLSVHVLPSNSSWFGVTYQEDKPEAVRRLQELIDAGEYPEKLWP